MVKSDDMRFILCGPLQAIGHSNGVMSLVRLGQALQARGCQVYFCVTNSAPDEGSVLRGDVMTMQSDNPIHANFFREMRDLSHTYGIQFLSDFSQEFIDSCYVVYPETMTGNSLDAKKIIRYFGNKNGSFKESVPFQKSDFVLAHSKVIHDNPDHVLFFVDVNPLFHDRDAPPASARTLEATYIGKGNLFGKVGIQNNTVCVERVWPSTKPQLATLLRNVRFFYTWDSWTHTNVEALYCGAILVFLRNAPWTDAEIDGTELGAVPRLTGDSVLGPNFFAEYDEQRRDFIRRVDAVNANWEPGVDEFIRKVGKHFEQLNEMEGAQ
jgi:hypothetical protein